MSGLEYVGDTSFSPCTNVDMDYRGKIDQWLERARNDFVTMGFALVVCTKSDQEVEDAMRALDGPDDERGEGATALMEAFRSYEKGLEKDMKLMSLATHRMIVIAERICGRETIEACYRH